MLRLCLLKRWTKIWTKECVWICFFFLSSSSILGHSPFQSRNHSKYSEDGWYHSRHPWALLCTWENEPSQRPLLRRSQKHRIKELPRHVSGDMFLSIDPVANGITTDVETWSCVVVTTPKQNVKRHIISKLPHAVQCTLQSYVAKGCTYSVHSFQFTVLLIMRVLFSL